MQILKWIRNRVVEPSTWAAAAVACVAVAFMIDQFWIAVGALVGAAIAMVLRERGII
jgi:hypothetical protein